MRRGVNMTYILENNGVYGLTKGQFSATADKGSKAKKGMTNETPPSTPSASPSSWARASSRAASAATKHQLVPLIKAAIAHQGSAFIDVISPCVAFNNHAGSTKSYEYVREHNEAVNRSGLLAHPRSNHRRLLRRRRHRSPPARRQHHQAPQARRLYDPTEKVRRNVRHRHAAEKGEVLTGLLYRLPRCRRPSRSPEYLRCPAV
jgi:2-oxoglutarate ferredoxin oxidoreductase subunit beta